jgi:hypothetical protein
VLPIDQPNVLANVDFKWNFSGSAAGSHLNVRNPGREKANFSPSWPDSTSLLQTVSAPFWQITKMNSEVMIINS